MSKRKRNKAMRELIEYIVLIIVLIIFTIGMMR